MLKKQTLDKNILTGKPQMCMLTIIILCLNCGCIEYFNNTSGILHFGDYIATIIERIACTAMQDFVVVETDMNPAYIF